MAVNLSNGCCRTWTQVMRKSIYLGAEHLMGFLTWFPSAQWYSYLGPADITEQDCSVQNSVIVPYNMLIWLKKSTVLTATHSLRSSPSGSITASRKFPEQIYFSVECAARCSVRFHSFRCIPDPRVAAACFISSCWWLPSGMFFFGLNVFEDLFPKRKLISEETTVLKQYPARSKGTVSAYDCNTTRHK